MEAPMNQFKKLFIFVFILCSVIDTGRCQEVMQISSSNYILVILWPQSLWGRGRSPFLNFFLFFIFFNPFFDSNIKLTQEALWSWSYGIGSWICNYMYNQFLSPKDIFFFRYRTGVFADCFNYSSSVDATRVGHTDVVP